VVDFAQNIPPQDTELVATSAALVVRDDLHPALVNLLAQSILAVQSQPQLNDKGESLLFPMGSEALAIDDPEFPVAPEAKRVYKSGPTFLQRVLPFWLGNLLDRTVILALPLIGVIIPLIRIVPIAYNWRMKNRILYWYRELKNLERDLPTKAPAHVIDAKVGELKRIEEGVRKIAVPIQYSADLYNLRDHIEFVARRLEVLKSQNLSSSEGVERVPA
jgi:hypothetical protein